MTKPELKETVQVLKETAPTPYVFEAISCLARIAEFDAWNKLNNGVRSQMSDADFLDRIRTIQNQRIAAALPEG